MENIHIYLAGGIVDLTLVGQRKWRSRIKDAIKYGDFELFKNPIFFDSTDYHVASLYDNVREVMEFKLNHLRKSDLLVVNFDNILDIEIAIEISIAKEYKIPIVGLVSGEVCNSSHPWLIECCSKVCSDFKEIVAYVVDFYLR